MNGIGGCDFFPTFNCGDGRASHVAVGGSHSCAVVAESGSVLCWGDDRLGQATPPLGLQKRQVVALAAGDVHTLALVPEPPHTRLAIAALLALALLRCLRESRASRIAAAV